jgi:hypothetical protein
MTRKLHHTDILRIAAEACRHPDTVRAVLEGGGNEMSRRAVEDAARRLGLALSVEPITLKIRAT